MVSKEQDRFIGDFSSTLERYAVISTFRNTTNSPSAGLLVYSEVSWVFFFLLTKFLKYWQMSLKFGSFGYSGEMHVLRLTVKIPHQNIPDELITPQRFDN